MGVNRSGYYKWRQRQGKMNRYERDREELTRLLQAAHGKQDSHGYHRLARDVSLETGGCFLTIWPTSVVRLQVFIQGPEKGVIDGLERKASYSPIR